MFEPENRKAKKNVKNFSYNIKTTPKWSCSGSFQCLKDQIILETADVIARLIREANKKAQIGARFKTSKKNEMTTVEIPNNAIRAKNINSFNLAFLWSIS